MLMITMTIIGNDDENDIEDELDGYDDDDSNDEC